MSVCLLAYDKEKYNRMYQNKIDVKMNFDKNSKYIHGTKSLLVPVPVAVRSEAWVCGRSLAGIAGSNPAGGIDVCLL